MLLPGDTVPHFRAASSVNAQFNFDTVGGRYVVITFLGSTKLKQSASFLDQIVANGQRFDVTNAIFFGVTSDADDVHTLTHQHPGRIYLYDLDLAVSRAFGVVDHAAATETNNETPSVRNVTYQPRTYILDQALRVIAIMRMGDDISAQVAEIFSILDRQPKLNELTAPTPVLIVPYVFEPALCRKLIDYYEAHGGEDSGFMNDVNGKTVAVINHSTKRRMDCEIADQELIRITHERLSRRVIPAIKQAFQFNVTRIERHIVACYDSAQGAHFKAHRDNTTLGTAHRRFAVTMNLNASEYDGGEIWFPEFGPKKYKAASGAAIVFSCSLLHEVPTVTRGKRYAFLPFLYDDAAAAVRQRNRTYLDIPASDGAKPAECGATAAKDRPAAPGITSVPMLDGQCGCGNPNGCGTCLSAPTYALGASAGIAGATVGASPTSNG